MYKRLVVFVILIVALSSCGISGSGQPLSFRSLAQDNILRSNPNDETAMIRIIANPEEINQIAPHLVDQLGQLDYNRFFAVLITQGRKGPHGFKITVQPVASAGPNFQMAMFIGKFHGII